MPEPIRVNVVFWGGSKSKTGCAETTLTLPPGATLGDADAAVAAQYAELAALLPQCRWARNHELVTLEQPLCDHDELALLPPVAGGAALPSLTELPLDPGHALDEVAGPDIGATVLFVGSVRNSPSDGPAPAPVIGLEYEAYPELAQKALAQIKADLEAAHPGCRLALSHRHGKLALGDIAVVIAAAAPHRAMAFDLCRAAIERVKVDVPIWKRELFATDSGEPHGVWVNAEPHKP
jgi:molybdopterin synthase catalytic subunit